MQNAATLRTLIFIFLVSVAGGVVYQQGRLDNAASVFMNFTGAGTHFLR